MSSNLPPAGWYPDPSGAQGTRWWDGQRWTDHTQQATPTPAPVATAPGQPPTYGAAAPTWAQNAKPRGTNHYALITFGIVAVYLVLAAATRIVFIGILPIVMSLRSQQRREPLAPLAIGAAVVSVIIALAILTHH